MYAAKQRVERKGLQVCEGAGMATEPPPDLTPCLGPESPTQVYSDLRHPLIWRLPKLPLRGYWGSS